VVEKYFCKKKIYIFYFKIYIFYFKIIFIANIKNKFKKFIRVGIFAHLPKQPQGLKNPWNKKQI
jgi:hypothetical protein